ncbi:MAG TPA: long-chain fatty acid--CoA ligase [Rhodospirillaceae bacterium]|nr:long-chain fatty acid--CoA ligase [Rhodospirillaceae bacterium]
MSASVDRPIAIRAVPSILEDSVRRFGSRPALDFLGRRLSYRELGALVEKAAAGFQRLGVKKGVRVGLCLPNTPSYVICFYAVLRAGGTVVNFNPLYVERELRQLVEDSGVTIMVTLDLKQIYPKVAQLLDGSGLEKIVICRMSELLPTIKGLMFSVLKRSELATVPDDARHLPFSRLLAENAAFQPVDIDPLTDVAVLQYTGGTTGLPKAAMLTHANLSANADQLLRLSPDLRYGEERLLLVLPLFHVFAMSVGMNVGISCGAELIMLPRFDLRQVLKTITGKRPTLFPGVPTIYNAINNAAGTGQWDLSSIKACTSGGAPLPREVQLRFEKLAGCALVEGYGLSECSPVVCCNPLGAVKEGSVGPPLPGTVVEIRAPEDPSRLLPTGEKGEICVRGPQVMAGYWRRPEDTAQVFYDGALRTGDIGYLDDEGFLFLVDRIKDVILCGGYNVYPRIIEEALYRHPAVAEAVVIGVPDGYRGEAPKAFVRLREGAVADVEELKHFLSTEISRIEMPKEIEFRAELPKTMVGKLSKKELVAEERARRLDEAS